MLRPRIVVEDAAGVVVDAHGEVTLGGRVGCSVVLDDALAAARHCAIEHDGAAFVVRDLGSVSGTWVDGARADQPVALRDGSLLVVGTSRAVARLETRDGAPTLVLALQRNGFWWRKPGKKVFDNDPDALVRSEVGFGRFAALAVGNRAALVAAAALLVASLLLSSVLEPLSDPGPLLPAHAIATAAVAAPGPVHARLQECLALASAQGCAVCHEPGGGVTEAKCRQCHGDLAAPATKRHPYLGDGDLAPATCVECHTDHQGMVAGGLKPGADDKTGRCEACHRADEGVRDKAKALSPPTLPPRRDTALAAHLFPHKAHLAKGMDCAVCHQVAPERRAAQAQGLPDDPLARDFGAIAYETCRSCHVAGSPAVGILAADQVRWRAVDRTWQVAWHGTDDGGGKCAQCHAAGDGAGRFGPAMRTVARPALTAAQHAAQRATYTVASRSHDEQFAEHAGGKDCAECHKNGLATARDAAAPRPFWHALHLQPAALQADDAAAGAISRDAAQGCRSCHQGLWSAAKLTDARTALYHWPSNEAERGACGACHVERGAALAIAATATRPATGGGTPPALAADFPHDVHVAAASFGQSGALAKGCYACHVFERGGPGEHQAVPRTLPGAADCSSCHTGHANVGGGDCQQCHPHAESRTTNSFLVSAGVADGVVLRQRPATRAGMRSWPGANGFRHTSPGHDGVACADCHDAAGTAAATTLAEVPIPDEGLPGCRACHLQRQFHWR
ncbi:MAG: cytochrome c3 family protein [Planctomycetota bacterium]